MELWQRLQHLQLTWAGLLVLIAVQTAALFLRRLLPPDRQHRGRITSYLLPLVPVLSLVARGLSAMGLVAMGAWLHVFNVGLTVVAVTGIAGMLVFDIGLARTPLAVPDLVRDLVYVLLFSLMALAVLDSGGIHPLSLAATSATLTAVIGLSMQTTLSNLGAGILLQFDRTVRLGDWIQVGSRTGRVEAFYARTTALRTSTGDLALVPNAQLLSGDFVNLSQPARAHRVTARLSFHHRHPPRAVAALVTRALADVPGVLSSPPPTCGPSAFNSEKVEYLAQYWIEDIDAEPTLLAEALTRVWYASQRAGFEGPCPEPEATDAAEREARQRALARTGLFATLTPDDRALLVDALRRAPYAAGERIITQGDAGTSMFVLAEGEVSVERDAAGKTAELAHMGPGDHFGEMSLLTGEARAATCRAVTDCVCYALDAAAFRRLVEAHPSLAEEVTRLVTQRKREHEARDSMEPPRDREAEDAMWRRVKTYFRL